MNYPFNFTHTAVKTRRIEQRRQSHAYLYRQNTPVIKIAQTERVPCERVLTVLNATSGWKSTSLSTSL